MEKYMEKYMEKVQKLSQRESTAVNIMKAVAILSVIAAHVVSPTDTDFLSELVSSSWGLFSRIGVIIFFVLGGFLYNRSSYDALGYWKKKFSRIIVPWLICSTLTYAIAVALGIEFGLTHYGKWVMGSGTWYYYITVYTLFLILFQWLQHKEWILYFLIVAQGLSLLLASFGISTTVPVEFVTDYLNPLHWIGYFAFGILARKRRWDLHIRRYRWVTLLAWLVMAASAWMLYTWKIFTYFHILTSLFCMSALMIIADLAYCAAGWRIAGRFAKIGVSSYCIYLLHMQIVQPVIARIPDSVWKILFAPVIGLGIMMMLITLGLAVCRRLPFGNKLKGLIGL